MPSLPAAPQPCYTARNCRALFSLAFLFFLFKRTRDHTVRLVTIALPNTAGVRWLDIRHRKFHGQTGLSWNEKFAVRSSFIFQHEPYFHKSFEKEFIRRTMNFYKRKHRFQLLFHGVQSVNEERVSKSGVLKSVQLTRCTS